MTPAAGFLGRIRTAFIIAAVAMAVFGAASYFTIDRLVTFGHSVVRSNDRLLDVERVEFALGDAEGALRELHEEIGLMPDMAKSVEMSTLLDTAADDGRAADCRRERHRRAAFRCALHELQARVVGVLPGAPLPLAPPACIRAYRTASAARLGSLAASWRPRPPPPRCRRCRR